LFVLVFFQAEDGIRDRDVTGVQTCALPICNSGGGTCGSIEYDMDYFGADIVPATSESRSAEGEEVHARAAVHVVPSACRACCVLHLPTPVAAPHPLCIVFLHYHTLPLLRPSLPCSQVGGHGSGGGQPRGLLRGLQPVQLLRGEPFCCVPPTVEVTCKNLPCSPFINAALPTWALTPLC